MTNPYIQNTVFGLHWQQKIRETNQLIRDNPDIQPAFKRWYYSYLSRYGKAPEPPYTVREVESLLYKKQRDMAMTTGYAYKRPFAATSGGYSTAPKRIRIIPQSLPSYQRAQAAAANAAAAAAAAKAASFKKEIKGMDTRITMSGDSVVSTTGTSEDILVLNLIQQGAGSWNRVGRKVFPKSVRIKGSCQISSIITTDIQRGNRIRFILVWDKNPNSGSIPQFDHIFGLTDQAGTEASVITAPIKYDNMDRYTILKEWNLVYNPGSSASGTDNTSGCIGFVQFDEYYKFKGNKFETVYSGQSTPMTIADISTGALYLVSRAENNIATNRVSIDSDSFARYRYTD